MAGLAGTLIRPVEPRDAPGVARVHVASWQATYRGIVPEKKLEELDLETATARWAACFEPNSGQGRAGETIWVLERDQRVAGFVAAGPCRDEIPAPPDLSELYALYVHPESWGQGDGSRLLRQIVGLLAERGARRTMLWVLEGNDRAHRFAAAHGFAADGATKVRPRGEVQLRELRYARDL